MGMTAEQRKRAERDEERREREARRSSREGNLEEAAAKVSSIYRKSSIAYDSLEAAFPAVDPALRPFGSDVIVQIRTPKLQTAGGIVLADETRETDQWNTQVAKVVAFGPVAFCNRETLQPWPEGAWAKVGMYVRVPKYGGDKWWREAPGSVDGKALFALFNDLDLKGEVPEDQVLSIIAYI
jgi:co-chaperonin GroES (HSP10)